MYHASGAVRSIAKAGATKCIALVSVLARHGVNDIMIIPICLVRSVVQNLNWYTRDRNIALPNAGV